jgi:hypothetical protein
MVRIASGDDDVQQQVTSTRFTTRVPSITLLRRLVKTEFHVHELMVTHRFGNNETLDIACRANFMCKALTRRFATQGIWSSFLEFKMGCFFLHEEGLMRTFPA